ncbi:MAG: hypothetical protein D6694_05175 [Gammaproteobacteria bacterium]|nr:MAG: hypothetical protein D6694_05175 [Gammaproteobacteria bacterium]
MAGGEATVSWRLWLVVCLLLGALVGLTIPHIPGYLVVVFDNYTAEVPLWLLALGLMLLFIAGISLAYLLGRTFRYWHRSVRRISGHSWRVARRKTIAAMVAFAEGNWADAEKLMIQAVKHADTKLINYLIAAEAAQKQGEPTRRDEYLRLAKEIAPEADLAIGLTQARAQMESNQLEQASANLEHLYSMAPRHPYVLQLLAETCYKMEDWPRLIQLLPNVSKTIPNPRQLPEWIKKAKIKFIALQVEAGDLPSLKKFWKKLSKADKEDESILVAYIEGLAKLGEQKQAVKLLQKKIVEAPTDECYLLYRRMPHPDIAKAFQWLEARRDEEPDNVVLLETLAVIAEKAELPGKARDYWEQVCAVCCDESVKLKLARVYNQLGESKKLEAIIQQLLD